ncbi:hypothetical protein J5N97_002211 [Dioscorea zingiberensis]|uniref:C2H2-type domain-containing protein n=1 Tax=Dioscorea zingiberensis TaxID=325984 RepID=A0A9D5D1T5_9LILI|nr:hypothetical protein J5N97_002211 [Dioscorea zingiberensis]
MNSIASILQPPKPSPCLPPLVPSRLLRSPPSSLSFPRTRTLNLKCSASAFDPTPERGASTAEVDMVRGRDGVWSAGQQKVVVLWDLDNKPPRGPPYEAAIALRRVAGHFGRVVDVSAYANRHAFDHLPQWVLDQRRERRSVDILERKGIAVPSEPYVCGVCGRKCRTNLELKRHFKQLHERERQKKLARMRSLKGKKRQKFKERFVSGNHKYEEAARELLTPKTGYGLASELRRAGVYVRTVADKPQAADAALKRQMQHSMARGMDWMVLVSDDSDFTDMVRRAREADLRTVVVGDGRRSLGRHADFWVPWMRVENGQVDEETIYSGRNEGYTDLMDDMEEQQQQQQQVFFHHDSSNWDYQSGDEASTLLDNVVDELLVQNSGMRTCGEVTVRKRKMISFDTAEGLLND